jgi:branched-chain amino acid transport system permease protein
VAGGVLYAYLDQRLTQLGGHLPGPLGQPLFVLGVLFILAVYFAGLRPRYRIRPVTVPDQVSPVEEVRS